MVPLSKVVSDAFKYSHIVLASATYNMGVFICMEQFLHDLVAHTLKNRKYVVIENGSWAPAAGKGMDKILEPLNWEKLGTTLTMKSAIHEDQLADIDAIADVLAADLGGEEKVETSEEKSAAKRFVCKVCGYIYEGDELPADYKCPLCGAAAPYFKEA